MLNLTPHALVIYAADGVTVIATLPSSGCVRCETAPQEETDPVTVGQWLVPVVTAQRFTGAVTGLPAVGRDGVYPDICVGAFGFDQVAAAYPGRVFATDTGPQSVVRDAKGAILGVKRLQFAGWQFDASEGRTCGQ